MGIFDRLFAKKGDPPKGTAGADGPQLYTDLIAGGEDVNRLLDGRGKWPFYEEMRKTDGAVRSTLMMFKLPIIQADADFEPYDESPDAELVAAACRWQFGLQGPGEGPMDLGWKEQLRQDLLLLDFGCMFDEDVWGDDLVEWSPPDDGGAKKMLRPLVRMAPRFPATIEEFELAKDGTIDYLKQDLPDTKPIPGKKITPYILDREGNNIFGTALLRPMFGPWKMKKALMIAAAIGWDRHAAGTPLVRYPSGSGAQGERLANEIGRSYRVHERGYITLEGAKPAEGQSGWDIEILNGSATLADPIPLLKHLDEQIALSALQMFAKLGTTETGARAVGEVLQEPFQIALNTIADLVVEARMRHAVRRFVNHNFGEDVPCPKLVLSGIGEKNVEALVSMIVQLSGAGFHFTEPELQNDLRGMLDLRELDPEVAEKVKEAQDAGFEVAANPYPDEGESPPEGQ